MLCSLNLSFLLNGNLTRQPNHYSNRDVCISVCLHVLNISRRVGCYHWCVEGEVLNTTEAELLYGNDFKFCHWR